MNWKKILGIHEVEKFKMNLSDFETMLGQRFGLNIKKSTFIRQHFYYDNGKRIASWLNGEGEIF